MSAMIYTKDVTVPKNTAVGSETRSTIKVANGFINKLDILFPSGCAGLVKVALFLEGTPLFPSTAGMAFLGDGETVSFPEFVKIRDAPRVIVVKASNVDDTYGHTISVRIGILPEDVLVPAILGKGITNMLSYLVNTRRRGG